MEKLMKKKPVFVLLAAVALILCALAVCLAEPVSISELLEEYDSVEPFVHGYACIGKGGLYGLINDGYELVVPVEYDCIRTFDIIEYYTDYGFCEVDLPSGMGAFDIIDRKLVVPCEYGAVYSEECEAGAYFIGRRYPSVEMNDGWWELCDYDIYDINGKLVYQTTAFDVRISDYYAGNIREVVSSEETGKEEVIIKEIPHNAGNPKKTVREEAGLVYPAATETALREAHDEIYVFYENKYYIAVDGGKACFIGTDGNVVENTKISSFEYEWDDAIRVNGKVY
ncbi:MAG: hypothetical protein IK019_09995 [Clostridia bacterium]|nr:hypothetical protein [Clostridia bacterium]